MRMRSAESAPMPIAAARCSWGMRQMEPEPRAARGVVFRGEPVAMGPITAVVFEDTCGNLINLVQPAA
jgi:hypothetical protein